jgi:hypothetical protein
MKMMCKISNNMQTIQHHLRFGHDNFQEAMKLVHRIDPALIDWRKFRYEVFDAPTYPGVYRDRYSFLGNNTCCVV